MATGRKVLDDVDCQGEEPEGALIDVETLEGEHLLVSARGTNGCVRGVASTWFDHVHDNGGDNVHVAVNVNDYVNVNVNVNEHDYV